MPSLMTHSGIVVDQVVNVPLTSTCEVPRSSHLITTPYYRARGEMSLRHSLLELLPYELEYLNVYRQHVK